MRRCPQCRRDYYDETLLYCLDDGSLFLDGPASGEPVTAVDPRWDKLRDDPRFQVLLEKIGLSPE